MARFLALIAVASLAGMLAVTVALAEPIVYLRPLCLDIQAGQTLTVHLSVGDTGDEISCFYAVIAYDPARIVINDVTEGGLYVSTSEPTYPGWTATAPDSFEVYNCILGSGTFVLGPGDLADIEVEGLVTGPAPMTISFIDIRDRNRDSYPTLFVVNCGTTGLPAEAETPAIAPRLRVAPNPAPGRARIELLGPVPAGSVDIYDVAGRLCRSLGVAAGGAVLRWDGRDDHGRNLPPGMYLIRGGEKGELGTKLLLIR